MLVPDEVRKCVVFVCFQSKEGIKLGGTAFFVSVPREGLEGHFGYMVTAKHIIDGINKRSTDRKVYLRVNVKDKPAELVSTDLDSWKYHPTESNVDVAVFPWIDL